jgi:hypothetical protein
MKLTPAEIKSVQAVITDLTLMSTVTVRLRLDDPLSHVLFKILHDAPVPRAGDRRKPAVPARLPQIKD